MKIIFLIFLSSYSCIGIVYALNLEKGYIVIIIIIIIIVIIIIVLVTIIISTSSCIINKSKAF